MLPNEDTVRKFLTRLGHPVALIGRKPLRHAPESRTLWPAQQDDPADQACYLSTEYRSVYCNLNPLTEDLLKGHFTDGISVRDNMIERRTRVLIDIDGHRTSKEAARCQKDEIKRLLGLPFIETDSGNGFGLIYECDLPNDSASKLRTQIFLRNLKARWSCVDASVFNAGQLTRVIGTLNRSKNDGSPIPSYLLN